jgi:serine/threonine protein kinase
MALEAGKRLGTFEVLEPIGAGGMGEVCRAKDTRLDRTVALKVLPSGLSANPALRELMFFTWSLDLAGAGANHSARSARCPSGRSTDRRRSVDRPG